MKRRFGFTALAVMVVWLSIMPAVMAAPGDTTMKATGTGDARALDLDVLGLVRLTISAADGRFELNTQGQGSATTSGRAVGICNLITGGSDPLACSAGNVATTSAPPDSGLVQNCLVPPINATIITVEAACGKSQSKVAGATPTGDHTASLAAIKVGLDAGLRQTLDQLVGTVTETAGGATGTVTDVIPGDLAETLAPILAAAEGVPAVTEDVLETVTTQLDSLVPSLANLAVIKVLPAEVHINGPAGKKTAKVEATSNVVDISLLDGLVQLQVTPSLASATYDGEANNNAGKASCHAEAAVVRVKVKNLLGGGELLNVAPGQNLAGALGGLANGLVGIKVASATPDTSGDTCRAEARGLELNLLQLLNGGIALRVASTNAEIAGSVTPLSLAAGPVCPDPKGCLPLTGGPTYLYMTGAFVMALGALGGFRIYRKLSATA